MNRDPGPPRAAVDRARGLARLFCDSDAEFGRLFPADAGSVPANERLLLDHHGHMTVTMERFHGRPVSLQVVAEHEPDASERRYAREILLVRGDGRVVQYGIVRIDLAAVPQAVAAAIRDRTIPLGRILVDGGLLCDVQDVSLLRIEPGPHLSGLVGGHQPLHGRVAAIHVDGLSAVELLEVVVPA